MDTPNNALVLVSEPEPQKKRAAHNFAYDPKYCDEIIEFFQRHRKSRKTTERVMQSVEEQNGSKRGTWKREVRRICGELPTIEGFAATIRVSRMTVFRWQRQFPDFAEAVAIARDIQCDLLTDRGLNGQYNPAYAMFVAKNVTWMRDSVDYTVTAPPPPERPVLADRTPAELETLRQLAAQAERLGIRITIDATVNAESV